MNTYTYKTKEGWANLEINTNPSYFIPEPIAPETALRIVADFFELGVDEILTKNRKEYVAKARHYAAWVLRKVCGLPLAKIGEMLGNRDHSTIMNSLLAIDNMMFTDPRERENMLRLGAKLGAAL
jgi:chromosomal replication initiator protein